MGIPLLRLREEEKRALRILYLAKYAENWREPPPVVHPAYGRELYTKYEVLTVLRSLAAEVTPCPTLAAFPDMARAGRFDYVFQIYNREPVRNPEILVSALCARQGLPYLGAPPNVRAMAEDKWISKLMARAAGIPVPEGAVYVELADLDTAPSFPAPYFIKPRFGANSEHVTENSIRDDWAGARDEAAALLAAGEEALVESLAPGMDTTVPILGGDPPIALAPVGFQSVLREGIATERQKRLMDGGRQGAPLEDAAAAAALAEAALRFSALVRPFDYLRVDFRLAPDGSFRLLEFNLTCNLGTHAAMAIGAHGAGVEHAAMIEHFLCYSLRRQRRSVQAASLGESGN